MAPILLIISLLSYSPSTGSGSAASSRPSAFPAVWQRLGGEAVPAVAVPVGTLERTLAFEVVGFWRFEVSRMGQSVELSRMFEFLF